MNESQYAMIVPSQLLWFCSPKLQQSLFNSHVLQSMSIQLKTSSVVFKLPLITFALKKSTLTFIQKRWNAICLYYVCAWNIHQRLIFKLFGHNTYLFIGFCHIAMLHHAKFFSFFLKVTLSKIFQWYKRDFAEKDIDLLMSGFCTLNLYLLFKTTIVCQTSEMSLCF